jgi:hypothetical protein
LVGRQPLSVHAVFPWVPVATLGRWALGHGVSSIALASRLIYFNGRRLLITDRRIAVTASRRAVPCWFCHVIGRSL